METQLTVQQQKAISLRDHLNSPQVLKQIQDALPEFLDAKRFLRVVYTQVLKNPRLLDCTRESFLSAMIQAAELGLEPTLGKAALIPYQNKDKLEVQFQPMYRGLIDLARRPGKVKITAHCVYEKDEFSFTYGLHEDLKHTPSMEPDRGKILGAYTCWTDQETGTPTFLFMPISDIYKIRDRSRGWQAYLKYKKQTVWITDEGEMCKKTVIKRHSKLQPCSIEMEMAVVIDDQVEMGEPANMIGEGLFALPTTEPETPNLNIEYKEKILDKTDIPRDKIDDFIKITAEEQKMTVNEVIEQAIENADSFLEYLKKWHEENKEDFQCPYCDHVSPSEQGRKKHITQSHKDKKDEKQGGEHQDPKSAWTDNQYWLDNIMPWQEELGMPLFNLVLARFDAKGIDEIPVDRRKECWLAMSAEADKEE